MRFLTASLVLGFFALMVVPYSVTFAQEPRTKDVVVQEEKPTAPVDWALNNQDGEKTKIVDTANEKGMLLVFIRSVDWCGYCQKQMKDIQSDLTEFQTLGFNPVSISYDSVETLKKFQQKANIGFTMLSDADSTIIKRFGLLNKEHEIGSRFYGIPYPAIYVLTKDGEVIRKYQENDYKERPDLQNVLDFLRQY